jgi:hypothetical protein
VLQAERDAALARITELETECASLRGQLHEAVKLSELQQADLERYKQAYEAARPNHPERVATDQLQLAFEQVLATLGPSQAVNDVIAQDPSSPSSSGDADRPARGTTGKRRAPHGRRPLLDLSNLEK